MASPLYRTTINVNAWNGLNVNVFHNDNTVIAPGSAGASLRTAFEALYGTLASWYPSGTSIAVGQIIDMSTTPPTYVPFDPTPYTLTFSGSRSDARQAATITWRSAVATRRGRGRSFIGPLNLNVESGTTGLWSDSFVGDLTAAASNLVDACQTGDVRLQVYSKVGNTQHEVTGFHATNVPHTLRSRTLR